MCQARQVATLMLCDDVHDCSHLCHDFHYKSCDCSVTLRVNTESCLEVLEIIIRKQITTNIKRQFKAGLLRVY